MKVKRIGALDGFKGIATVLLVILASLPGTMTRSSLVGYPFMVIMGYLVTVHMEQAPHTFGQLLKIPSANHLVVLFEKQNSMSPSISFWHKDCFRLFF